MSTLTTLGILDIIYWPFGMLMKGIYSLVGNYGIAIIIFGIIVKLILLPFAFSNEKTRLRNMPRGGRLSSTRLSRFGQRPR